MNYSDFNYKNDTVRRYPSNFLTSTHDLRFPPRYLRQPIDHRARSYGIRTGQPRRPKFSSRNPQFRRNPTYSQQRLNYWGFGTPVPNSSPAPPNNVKVALDVVRRIFSVLNLISKIGQFWQSKAHAQLAAWGCTPGGCCVATAATTVVVTVVVASVGLGVGLGVGLQHNDQSVDTTTTTTTPFILNGTNGTKCWTLGSLALDC